jgi:hypothetical protein
MLFQTTLCRKLIGVGGITPNTTDEFPDPIPSKSTMRSVCLDCAQIEAPTAVTIDQLARLQLAMRRCGCELELSNAQPCLLELIGLFGLAEVLPVESERDAEKREDPGGVEEKGELGDPPIG